MADRKRPTIIDLTGEEEKRPRTRTAHVSDDTDAALCNAPPTVRPDGIVVSSSTQQLQMIAVNDGRVCGAKHTRDDDDDDDAGPVVPKKVRSFRAVKTHIQEGWIHHGYKWNDSKLDKAVKLMHKRATESLMRRGATEEPEPVGILKVTEEYAIRVVTENLDVTRGLTFLFGNGAFQVHVRFFDEQLNFFLEFMKRVSKRVRLAIIQEFAQLLHQYAERYPIPNVFFCFPTHTELQGKFQVTPTYASPLFFNDCALDGVHTTAVLLKGTTIELSLDFKLFGDDASLCAREKLIANLTHFVSAPLGTPFNRLVDLIEEGSKWIAHHTMPIERLQREVLNVPAHRFDPTYFQILQIRTSQPKGKVCARQISDDLVATGAILSPDDELLESTLGDVSLLSSTEYFRHNRRDKDYMGAFGMIIVSLDVFIIAYDGENQGLM
jgi:hypothetical protein